MKMGALSKDASILKSNLANAGTRKTDAATALGRAGGLQKSAKKTAAAKRNGAKGGWPKGRPRKPSLAYRQMFDTGAF
jgi:hypothetical protein